MQPREKLEAILADWRMRWPAVFTKAVPLGTGTARCMREQLAGQLSRQDIDITLRYWTHRSSYLRAVARGDTRRNLDGSEAGFPTEEIRERAQCLLFKTIS